MYKTTTVTEHAVRITFINGDTAIHKGEWTPGHPRASFVEKINSPGFVSSWWGSNVVRAELVVRTVTEEVVAASDRTMQS